MTNPDFATAPLYLDAAAVASCLPDAELYEVVKQTLRESVDSRAVNGPKVGFGVDVDGEHLHMGSVSGFVRSGEAAGLKWFVIAERNASRKLPRVPATVLVCDARTGLLDGILDATQLTPDRTAAMAIAAASACGGASRRVAVVGAGLIGRALIRLLALNLPVEEILVASLRQSSAGSACAEVAASLPGNVRLSAVATVREAVRDADIIFTATGISEDSDLVRAEWLKTDAIVCWLGSRREVDVPLISEACIVVDDPDGVKLRHTEFREGRAGSGRIAGTLGHLMAGSLEVLPRPKQRILLVLVGMGVLDVALGARALANARLAGAGIPLQR
jgi:ornithine cyclodeaminase/alanine dehydrogenase-like protein (mu-crystallin family)